MLLLTSILSAAVVGAIGYQSGRNSLRASVFDRLTEIRQSQIRQLQAQFVRPEELAGDLHAGIDGHRGHRGVHRGLRPAQQRHRSPRRNSSRSSTTTTISSPRPRTRRPATVDVDALLPTSNAQKYLQAYYTAPFTDWDTGDQIRRRPRRQRVVGGQRPLQRLLPRDRHALRVRGRPAARHPRQRRLQRLQGRRSRHQHPHRPVPRAATARAPTRRRSPPTPSTTSASPTSATTSRPTNPPPGWCRRSDRRAASKAFWRCSSRSPRSTG